MEDMDTDQEPVVVTRISGGGDHSFAVVNSIKKKQSPVDYRTHYEAIETLSSEF